MQLVDRHVIRNTSPFWAEIDDLAFRSKNLFNFANYQIRQRFIFQREYLNYNYMAAAVKDSPDYKALPAKVSQQILMRLDESWRSFFAAIKEWSIHPEKFLGRPKLPKYKDKKKGRNVLTYTIQAISQKWLKQGWINLSMTNVFIKVLHDNVRQVRIVPKCDHYVIEVVYEKEAKDLGLNPGNIASLDLGVNNLAALTSNNPGFQPVLINGRLLDKLTGKHNRQIRHAVNKAARMVITHCLEHGIGTVVFGWNQGQKDGANMGRKTNQKFVQIPTAKLKARIAQLCETHGIIFVEQEESYTSKASALDLAAIPVYGEKPEGWKASGRRIRRGTYRSAAGVEVNADCNGAWNIGRKANVTGMQGTPARGVLTSPRRLRIWDLPGGTILAQKCCNPSGESPPL